MITIYHNPACRKSRETLKLITDSGAKVEVVEYIKKPLTRVELSEILQKLEMEPEELVRKGEAIFKDKFKGKEFSKDDWLKIMIEYPKLMERPIVVKKDQAIIGRPPENVLKLL
ncbi:MAG: arsenate reductase (glutaredoxin) [Bacteroidota bacterium]